VRLAPVLREALDRAGRSCRPGSTGTRGCEVEHVRQSSTAPGAGRVAYNWTAGEGKGFDVASRTREKPNKSQRWPRNAMSKQTRIEYWR
jgi:hypothetical protein